MPAFRSLIFVGRLIHTRGVLTTCLRYNLSVEHCPNIIKMTYVFCLLIQVERAYNYAKLRSNNIPPCALISKHSALSHCTQLSMYSCLFPVTVTTLLCFLLSLQDTILIRNSQSLLIRHVVDCSVVMTK